MMNEKGISLVETLIVATLMLVVLSTAFLLIVHFGDAQRTQLAQTRLSEESRFMFNAFADELKDAGAILTLAHSNTFLGVPPYFNGIFPLDKTNGPDGIIIASGDPNGATTLTSNYTPTSGSPIPVKSTLKKDGNPAWASGDKGIIIASNGYYVFSVNAAPTATTLPVRPLAVYYSGLLTNCGTYQYSDTLLPSASGVLGKDIPYAGGLTPPFTPVMRLSNFCIYLFDKVNDPRLKRDINRMYGITDTKGERGSALLTSSQAVVSDNVCDMQLSYTFIPVFPVAAPTEYTLLEQTPVSVAGETIYSMIQKKFLKEINISLVVLTDEYGGTGKRVLTVPAIKNRASFNLPSGKYSFKIYSYNIQNKNYNIVI